MESFKERFLSARRAHISADFKNLNPRQLEAVLATEGPLLILAGAGSGKTTVLIHRVANLLRYGCASDSEELPEGADEAMLETIERGGEEASALCALRPVEPWRILAITFTNKAANELKERLGRLLGEDAQDVWACTFHSACVRILRRDAEKLGFPDSFTIYDSSDSQSLVKHIVKDLNLDEKTFVPRAVLAEISRAKDSQLGAEDYLTKARQANDLRRVHIGEIYSEYMRRLFAAGAMDYDDLIAFTVKLLQEYEEVRSYWQRRFRYVLIDEYQDTNHLQYLLSSLLAGGWGNICVVGDDDQSIYKFRGATIENILSFEEEYKRCRTIRLEQNYRSTGQILDAANAVIRHNVGRKGKELWTKSERGQPVRLYVAANEREEAQFVVSSMMSSFGRGGSWRDNAVLFRMNAQSNQLEYALKRNGVPYRVFGGMRFFDRAEIKDVLAYLSVISVPSDDLRLLRIINNPPRGIGQRSIELAQGIAAQEELPLFEVLHRADDYPELKRSALRMRELTALLTEFHSEVAQRRTDELLDELLEKTGYLKALEEKGTPEETARAENVQELKTSILSYEEETGDTSLQGYLSNVALYTDLDNYDREADAVVLMTMHAAKGLEFPNVYVVGMEEGVFPSLRAIGEPEEMEEERRLCYVAITRAMRQLTLVCARERMLFGRTTANRVSRFVEEIPEELIEGKPSPKRESHGYEAERRSYASVRKSAPPRKEPLSFAPSAPKPQQDLSFEVGDRVRHRAFGLGQLLSKQAIGNDFLIEVKFETGSKKMMLRIAAQNMTKEDGE